MMLLHTYDGFDPISTLRKSVSGKYRALKTLWTSEEVFVCRRQPCLARRARLKAFRSRNPKPPLILDT